MSTPFFNEFALSVTPPIRREKHRPLSPENRSPSCLKSTVLQAPRAAGIPNYQETHIDNKVYKEYILNVK